jgi:IS30 family transposase
MKAPYARLTGLSRLSLPPRSERLRHEVEHGFARRWSPQQIAARLKVAFPKDLEMCVSHETICQSLLCDGVRRCVRNRPNACVHDELNGNRWVG